VSFSHKLQHNRAVQPVYSVCSGTAENRADAGSATIRLIATASRVSFGSRLVFGRIQWAVPDAVPAWPGAPPGLPLLPYHYKLTIRPPGSEHKGRAHIGRACNGNVLHVRSVHDPSTRQQWPVRIRNGMINTSVNRIVIIPRRSKNSSIHRDRYPSELLCRFIGPLYRVEGAGMFRRTLISRSPRNEWWDRRPLLCPLNDGPGNAAIARSSLIQPIRATVCGGHRGEADCQFVEERTETLRSPHSYDPCACRCSADRFKTDVKVWHVWEENHSGAVSCPLRSPLCGP
jgi:hypothetical protein